VYHSSQAINIKSILERSETILSGLMSKFLLIIRETMIQFI
jgi:hypothetical protein